MTSEGNKTNSETGMVTNLAMLGCFLAGVGGLLYGSFGKNPFGLLVAAVAFGAVVLATYRR